MKNGGFEGCFYTPDLKCQKVRARRTHSQGKARAKCQSIGNLSQTGKQNSSKEKTGCRLRPALRFTRAESIISHPKEKMQQKAGKWLRMEAAQKPMIAAQIMDKMK